MFSLTTKCFDVLLHRLTVGVFVAALLQASATALAIAQEQEPSPTPKAEQLRAYEVESLPAKEVSAKELSALPRLHCYGYRGAFRVNRNLLANDIYRDRNETPHVDDWFTYVGDQTVGGTDFRVYKKLLTQYWLYFEKRSGTGYIQMREKLGSGGDAQWYQYAYQIED